MVSLTLKSSLRKLAPRSIRPYLILGGPLRGRTIVTSPHDYPAAILGRTEGPLLRWFRSNVQRGEIWADIGAHYGYTAIALAELVGHEGRVYAFEPFLATAGHLSRTRLVNRLEQITVVPVGLAGPGPIRSIPVATERGMANRNLLEEHAEAIFVIGFDTFWESCGSTRLDGAKIDVQGMELEVLRGMSKTLAADRPKLAIEFHSGVDRTSVLTFLSDIGYRTPGTPIDPVANLTEPAYLDNHSYEFQPLTR
jgi:FkbM family methyltransferase